MVQLVTRHADDVWQSRHDEPTGSFSLLWKSIVTMTLWLGVGTSCLSLKFCLLNHPVSLLAEIIVTSWLNYCLQKCLNWICLQVLYNTRYVLHVCLWPARVTWPGGRYSVTCHETADHWSHWSQPLGTAWIMSRHNVTCPRVNVSHVTCPGGHLSTINHPARSKYKLVQLNTSTDKDC